MSRAGVSVILLDPLNTLLSGSEPSEETPTWVEDHALANAKQHAVKFVAQMARDDVVAIHNLGERLNVLCDFTNDREKLLAVLKDYKAVSLTRRDDAEPLAVHTKNENLNKEIDRQRAAFAGLVNRKRAEQTMGALLEIADTFPTSRDAKTWFG